MTEHDLLKDMEKKPLHVKCRDCGWVFIAAYTPMLLIKFAALLEGVFCPRCGVKSDRLQLWSDRTAAQAAMDAQT